MRIWKNVTARVKVGAAVTIVPVNQGTGVKPAIHYLEYLIARAGFGVMGLLPYRSSSRVFGALFATVGPRLSAHNRILVNLALVRAGMPIQERHRLAREVWRNFGYTLVDLAHLGDLRREPERITINGAAVLSRLKEEGGPVVFFSAHIACWEIIRIAARRHGFALSMIYRRFNNPFVDAYAQKVQSAPGEEVLQKGVKGARGLIRLIREGKSALILADQRLANGVEVDFLGKPAMTAPAVAEIGLKYGARIVPAHVIRRRPGHYDVVFDPPLKRPAGDDHREDIRMILQQVNRHLGSWIDQNPAQWLWLHRRWKDFNKSE